MMNSSSATQELDDMTQPHQIVIVGGGTAGWMAANLLAHHWRQHNVAIRLIESPEIGIVGVGEGSTPTLKRFFQELDIPESAWMQRCQATYKLNIRFAGWSPQSGLASYSHPFISQLDVFSEHAFYVNCFNRRLGLAVATDPEQFLLNGYLAKQQAAPQAGANFPFRVEYGYHFDSGLLGHFLREHAQQLGVEHLPLTITAAEQHPDGRIAAVVSSDGQRISGDFFIDCSGFQSLLLQKTLGVSFKPFADNLFNNAAVVLPTATMADLPAETKATALSSGWAWQIPLLHRTGNGYVYSTDFISKDQAELELRQHLGLENDAVVARHLMMNVGQVAEHWQHNCVAIGLSQGFIEPLEATALHLVQTTVETFIEDYQAGGFTNQYRQRFNQAINGRFEATRDYIVAHYKYNTRTDSAYWQANRENQHLSESFLQRQDVWFRMGDLGKEIERQQLQSMFGNTSWHCLLAGYGVFPALAEKQPDAATLARTDQYIAQGIGALFSGCALNFRPQRELLLARS
jgi:2-polyprenyl-6-methoxyphenol hydroxylase-like FAD-dependent oxidoreductase